MYASCRTSSTRARSSNSADAKRRRRAWCRRIRRSNGELRAPGARAKTETGSALTAGQYADRRRIVRSAPVALVAVPAVARAGPRTVRAVDRLELLEAPPGADC